MPSALPDDYIPDVNTDYRSTSALPARKRNQLEEIKVELIDCFGLLPDPARTLLDIARLRQQAQKLGIRKLKVMTKAVPFNLPRKTTSTRSG
ncbi:TRCF domain-containing protein [Shigella flexneri]